MQLRYAIIGTGALGGYYGGKLAHAGKDVHFLFHSDYGYVVEQGLRVDSVDGNIYLPTVNAYRKSSEMPPCDVVLVCLKTTSNHELDTILPPLLTQGTCVILIQNGLSMEDELAFKFPSIHLGGGLGFICSSKVGPGHIVHADYGKLTLAPYTTAAAHRVGKIAEDMREAGIETVYANDLAMARWRKLVWNIPFNGLCVALNTSTDKLMEDPHTYDLLKGLMLEVIGAAGACGKPIEKIFAQEMLDSTQVMRPYAPSMKLDFDNRRPLEIRAIYSNPLKAASLAGYDMPKVRMLEQQLSFIMESYRGQGK